MTCAQHKNDDLNTGAVLKRPCMVALFDSFMTHNITLKIHTYNIKTYL